MVATPQSTPQFTSGGSVFGRIPAQWNAYFGAKVDAENGTADNLTVTGTLTVAGFTTSPLNSAQAPLQLATGTLTLNYVSSIFAATGVGVGGTGALTLSPNGITNGFLGQMMPHTYKGNNTGVPANAADITSTQLTADLNVFTSTLKGVAPASGGVAGTYLDATGAFSVPASTSVPTGAGMEWYTAVPPAGWLIQDGSSVSRATYPALFAVIGTTFGSINGSSFNLPDKRGRVAAGYDPGNATGRLTGSPTGGVSAAAIGNTGGEQGHVLAFPAEIPAHPHAIVDQEHEHVSDTPTNNSGSFGTGANPPSASGSGDINNQLAQVTTQSFTGITTTQNAGSGGAHNNVPPAIIVNWIIKT